MATTAKFVAHRGSFPTAPGVRALANIVKACPASVATPKEGTDGTKYLYSTERCIVIPDAFPKSTVHFLVIPRDPNLVCLNSLTSAHCDLLQHMMEVADTVTNRMKSENADYANLRYISGFHAIPSLPQLHMHRLSMDLESDRLKNKKHYNTFASYFFLPAEQILADLKAHGHVTMNQDVDRFHALEKGDMKCLWCGLPLAGMPMMKSHVPSCEKNMARIERSEKVAKRRAVGEGKGLDG